MMKSGKTQQDVQTLRDLATLRKYRDRNNLNNKVRTHKINLLFKKLAQIIYTNDPESATITRTKRRLLEDTIAYINFLTDQIDWYVTDSYPVLLITFE